MSCVHMCGKKHLFYRCIFILFLLYIPLQVGYRVHLYLYFKFVSCYYCTELLTFVFVFTKKNCWFKSSKFISTTKKIEKNLFINIII